MEEHSSRKWWPFTTDELQVALGIYGFVATTLAFTGLEPRVLAWCSVAFVALFYLAGLLVHARAAGKKLSMVPEGGLGGVGHIAPFRAVRRCLFLMHVDDDAPQRDLLNLYRKLLERGVEIRRLVFLRANATPSAYDWLIEFGDHEHLQHRVVFPDQVLPVHFSFAVVDDRCVMLSVPGWEAIDGRPYATHLVLRNLLVLRERSVASVFQNMHEEMWERALPLSSVAELSDPKRLAARCQKRGAA